MSELAGVWIRALGPSAEDTAETSGLPGQGKERKAHGGGLRRTQTRLSSAHTRVLVSWSQWAQPPDCYRKQCSGACRGLTVKPMRLSPSSDPHPFAE